ncbi:MAG: hypothetical protein GY811_21285 [Myxococcales bacterium]|nr:hypothetical protein [Myxococcales bacterium]
MWHFSGYEVTTDDDDELRPVDEIVDVDEILRLRDEQRSLPMAKVEAKTQAEREGWQNAGFADATRKKGRDCPDISASIDWTTVSDSMLAEIPVAKSCGPMVSAADDFCQQHPHRAKDLSE